MTDVMIKPWFTMPEWLVTTLSLFILLALAGALISPIFCKMDDGKDP